MVSSQPITRRESIKRILHISGGLAISGTAVFSLSQPFPAWSKNKKNAFLSEGIGLTNDYSVDDLLRRVFEISGGIHRFISRGDVVVIKPNVSWARAPHLAATTNPKVLESVIRLCKEAGAKKIRIADNTIHDARRCFAVTGIGEVAKKTHSDLVHPRSSLMREMNIDGHRLGAWPVFVPFIEADKIINVPVAKHHGLSGLTLGMKNWIGGVGGSRWALHQDIHQSIVDLAQFFKPTITLIDATRIMIRNGPSGGSPSDTVKKNTLILSNDPVAADAKASVLFGYKPEDVGFVKLGQKWGLGTYDFNKLSLNKVTL